MRALTPMLAMLPCMAQAKAGAIDRIGVQTLTRLPLHDFSRRQAAAPRLFGMDRLTCATPKAATLARNTDFIGQTENGDWLLLPPCAGTSWLRCQKG